MRWSTESVRRAAERVVELARAGHDIAEYAAELDRQLQRLIPHSASCVVTVDPATGLLTGTYKFGALAGAHQEDNLWAQLEYGSDDPSRMSVIAHREVPALACSQLPGGATDSIRIRDLVGPGGFADELRMVARDGEHSWGGVNLFRTADDPPFDQDEVLLLASLSESVAHGLRTGLIARSVVAPVPAQMSGPAVLLVAGDAPPRQVTFGAEDLLHQLTDEQNRSPAASVVHGVVAATHRYAAGLSSAPPRARLRDPSGRWLVAQGAPLATDGSHDGDVVVIIDEARPPEIVSILASTFGLTVREREVTQLVLSGTDTRGIADELSMSAYTVQDHLKSVFDKVDVRSRRELVARVFFDQYAPRMADGVAPDGWFRPHLSAPATPLEVADES